MTRISAAQDPSHGEGDRRERLEPRTDGAAALPPRLSPQAAVDAAAWQVGGPVLVLMLGPAVAVLFVGVASGAPAVGLLLTAAMVLIPSWLVAWLAWSILTPRWRLWAYERVDDLVELKRIALADRVLWPDGHIIHRSELAPAALRERLTAIEAERRTVAEPQAAPASPQAEPKSKPRAGPRAQPKSTPEKNAAS